MRIFKTKTFARFCRKSGIEDLSLLAAVNEILAGLIDADLGSGVFKQRVARQGEGKSGGFRTIVLLKLDERVLFVLGYAKKDRANIEAKQLEELRELARCTFRLEDQAVESFLEIGRWLEVKNEK